MNLHADMGESLLSMKGRGMSDCSVVKGFRGLSRTSLLVLPGEAGGVKRRWWRQG